MLLEFRSASTDTSISGKKEPSKRSARGALRQQRIGNLQSHMVRPCEQAVPGGLGKVPRESNTP